MLDMRGRAVRDVLTVQSHRAVAVRASKLAGAVADGIGDGRDHPLPTFRPIATEEFLHFALIDFLTHIPDRFLQVLFGTKVQIVAPSIRRWERNNSMA